MDNCFNCQWHDVVEIRGAKYNACMIGGHSEHVWICPDVPCEDWEEKEDERMDFDQRQTS